MSVLDWIEDRFGERSSWDGGALIAIGLIVVFLGPFAKIAAYGAIIWGAISLLWPEKK
jgi:hypothetical protein